MSEHRKTAPPGREDLLLVLRTVEQSLDQIARIASSAQALLRSFLQPSTEVIPFPTSTKPKPPLTEMLDLLLHDLPGNDGKILRWYYGFGTGDEKHDAHLAQVKQDHYPQKIVADKLGMTQQAVSAGRRRALQGLGEPQRQKWLQPYLIKCPADTDPGALRIMKDLSSWIRNH
jgi:hypothetical protein